MGPRKHHRTSLLGTVWQTAGVWVPLLVVAMLLLALVLGGPSPRY